MTFQVSASLLPEGFISVEMSETNPLETTEKETVEELVIKKATSKTNKKIAKVFRLIQLANYSEIETFIPNKEKGYATSLHKVHESYLI